MLYVFVKKKKKKKSLFNIKRDLEQYNFIKYNLITLFAAFRILELFVKLP
jgi:hypothetical protein